MPVVMTGSPGGAIGGASGPAFGSGLAGITSPPKKLFSPSLEVWARRGEEDAAITKERKADYNALKDARLSADAEKKKAAANAKAAAKAEFAARQKERSDAEAEEKKRMMSYRNEALQKPTLGSIEPSSASKAAPVGESWLWPTAKKHPGVTVKGVGSEHKEAMDALPRNVDAAVLISYTEGITKNSKDLTKEAVAVRKAKDEEARLVAEKERKEREEEQILMRRDLARKAEAAKRAEVLRSKQIKKEMAEETRKQAKEAEQQAKIRADKAQKEREEMIRHLKMDMKLRDEDEIANERREGSSMSKGGKAAFVASAKKGNVGGGSEF